MSHTKRPQNSTVAGWTSLSGMVFLILQGHDIKDTLDVLMNLGWDQLMPILMVLVGSLRAIMMRE